MSIPRQNLYDIIEGFFLFGILKLLLLQSLGKTTTKTLIIPKYTSFPLSTYEQVLPPAGIS